MKGSAMIMPYYEIYKKCRKTKNWIFEIFYLILHPDTKRILFFVEANGSFDRVFFHLKISNQCHKKSESN
jgi:hypothetical protein